LNRLQELTSDDGGHTSEFAYGKAGKLSFAEKIVPPQPAPEPQLTITPSVPLPRAPARAGAPYPLTPKSVTEDPAQ